MLKQMIRVPESPRETPDLSKFRFPKIVEKGRKRVHKYSPIADGFVGSELSVPPKQKRVRRFRGSRGLSAGGLELVQGPLHALGQSVEIESEMREINSPHGLDAASKTCSENLFDDDAVVPSLDNPEGRVQTAATHRHGDRCLGTEQRQGGGADRAVSMRQHGGQKALNTQPTTRHALDLMKGFHSMPAKPYTEIGEEDEEMEGPREIESQASDQEADNGSSSEAGSSSDRALADAGNPLIERTDDNTYEGKPYVLTAAPETISDRFRSTPKFSENQRALSQRCVPPSPSESQCRRGSDDYVNDLTRPGQAARMESSGMWMEVPEEIVSTPAANSRLSDCLEKKKGKKSEVPSEAFGSSLPDSDKRQLVAAAVPASSKQRTGHGTAEDSGNCNRRYSTYAKGSVACSFPCPCNSCKASSNPINLPLYGALID